jgi:hypothetical protein
MYSSSAMTFFLVIYDLFSYSRIIFLLFLLHIRKEEDVADADGANYQLDKDIDSAVVVMLT